MKRKRMKGTAFEQVARRVLANARFLLRHRRWHSAIYLAGYAVECRLKAAICRVKGLATLPPEYQTHDLWRLLEGTGLVERMRRDPDIFKAFERVTRIWGTEIRYAPKPYGRSEAVDFFDALRRVITWLEAIAQRGK
ncbi:MAG: HEPN domain-containing protein [Armatimonadota bacterium]|nr:HEPN domain-containing protein [Armatimonadota bacterium]MDT7971734.1 HEPN domain-containing protein [Armatimonadota bacterium]